MNKQFIFAGFLLLTAPHLTRAAQPLTFSDINDICGPLMDLQQDGGRPRITKIAMRSEEDFARPSFENCRRIARNFPNKNALKYAVHYLANNTGKLSDNSCISKAYLKRVKNGIQNGCSAVINDVETPWPGFNLRSTGYYVDFCRGSVRSFFFNKGKGKGYADAGGKHTTILGAFLTAPRVETFTPYRWSTKYRTLRRQLGGRIPKLALTPLQASNQRTAASKPLHASPYQSSWGCASVGPQTAKWLFTELERRGPSLMINYANPKLNPIESVRSCNATPNELQMAKGSTPYDRRRPASASRSSGRRVALWRSRDRIDADGAAR